MSHSVSVIMAREELLAGVIGRLPGATLHPAAQQVALIPVDSALLERLGPLTQVHAESFRLLTSALEALLAQWSRNGPVAYLETNYFGGLGSQASALWRRGSLELGPLIHDTTPGHKMVRTAVRDLPINTVIRALGVTSSGSMDEFDTVGFGGVRSNQDWSRSGAA